MQKNQSDRYQSASEILRDIDEYKKNPNIKFDYSYFTATQPGTATETDEDIKVATPIVTKADTVIEPLDADDTDTEEDDSAKKKTIAVLCGVLGALVIFAVILISMFLPGSNKITVPNVVGLNFYNQVMNQPAYADFVFEPVIDEESDAEAGTILRQDPSSGKVNKNTKIVIYISDSSSQVEVPDVYGYEYTSADAVIRGKGLETTVVKERNEDVEIGTVIKTYPAKGEMVAAGSMITIYVATSEDVEPVAVPNLVGMTIAQARATLSEAGLTLDTTRTEYRGSAEPAGKIIGHEYIGEMVLPGTRVAVYVSTGKIPETTDETTEEEETEEEKTTEEKKTTRPKTTKPTTTKPTTTKPTTTKPTTTQPTTTQPTTTKPTTTAPTTTKPTTTAPTTTQPPTAPTSEPSTTEVQAQDTTLAEQVNGEQ